MINLLKIFKKKTWLDHVKESVLTGLYGDERRFSLGNAVNRSLVRPVISAIIDGFSEAIKRSVRDLAMDFLSKCADSIRRRYGLDNVDRSEMESSELLRRVNEEAHRRKTEEH